MTTHTTATHPHSDDTDTDTHTDTHKDTTSTTALSKGLAGIKQDFQQRESVLQATNKQLQEALTRTNFEAGLREDSLRQELGEMRKRWQDAVSRTEGLAADMHESTAPLLRQIKALQEETRYKAQAWYVCKCTCILDSVYTYTHTNTHIHTHTHTYILTIFIPTKKNRVSAEEALTERARTAEGLARTAEAGRVQVGEKVEELTAKVGELELQLSGTTRKLHETAAQLKTMEGLEAEGREKVSVLEQELKEVREAGVRQGKEGKAQEVKLKLQLQEAKDALVVMKGDLEHEQARLQMEVEALKKELSLAVSKARERGEEDAAAMAAGVGGGRRSSFTPRGDGGGRERESFSQSSILERTISGSLGNGGRSSSASDAGVGVGLGGGGGAGGDVSVLALEKLQQALHQKEAEASHLQSRLHDVERTRDALTAEVTMLGKKTSLLQGSLAAAKQLRVQVAELGQQKEVLLELLGEKTEELEVLQVEMDGLKAHFRRQLDALLSGQGQQQQHKIAV